MLMKMHAAGWSFVFALCFICVSPNDEKSCGDSEDFCEKIILRVSLSSSVLLPCNLRPTIPKWVTWSHAATKQAEMVQLSSEGHVKFLDPRKGRVKAFPLQGCHGNYSIRIVELEISDLGCYRCGWQCVQVQLPETGQSSSELVISVVTRVAALLLLCVGGYCCYKCISHCNNKTKDSANSPTTAGSEGAEK